MVGVGTGTSGKQTADGIVETSAIRRNIENGTICIFRNKNSIASHVFVRDATYPMKGYLMRPFSG